MPANRGIAKDKRMHEKVILLVEDNPDDVKLALRALRNSHILNKIVVAGDGAQALDFLLRGKAPDGGSSNILPTVVLLDLKLPKVDGLEVLKQVRADERLRRLPVVVLTSSSEERDLISSYDLGANSYIRKPVDFEQFTEAVRQLGLYWLLLNQAAPTPLTKS